MSLGGFAISFLFIEDDFVFWCSSSSTSIKCLCNYVDGVCKLSGRCLLLVLVLRIQIIF